MRLHRAFSVHRAAEMIVSVSYYHTYDKNNCLNYVAYSSKVLVMISLVDNIVLFSEIIGYDIAQVHVMQRCQSRQTRVSDSFQCKIIRSKTI